MAQAIRIMAEKDIAMRKIAAFATVPSFIAASALVFAGMGTVLSGVPAWAQPLTLQETEPEFQEAIWCQLALGGISMVVELNEDEEFVAEIGTELFAEKVFDRGQAQGMDQEDYRALLTEAAPLVEQDLLTARYGEYRMIDYCFAKATERYHELAQCQAEQRLDC